MNDSRTIKRNHRGHKYEFVLYTMRHIYSRWFYIVFLANIYQAIAETIYTNLDYTYTIEGDIKQDALITLDNYNIYNYDTPNRNGYIIDNSNDITLSAISANIYNNTHNNINDTPAELFNAIALSVNTLKPTIGNDGINLITPQNIYNYDYLLSPQRTIYYNPVSINEINTEIKSGTYSIFDRNQNELKNIGYEEHSIYNVYEWLGIPGHTDIVDTITYNGVDIAYIGNGIVNTNEYITAYINKAETNNNYIKNLPQTVYNSGQINSKGIKYYQTLDSSSKVYQTVYANADKEYLNTNGFKAGYELYPPYDFDISITRTTVNSITNNTNNINYHVNKNYKFNHCIKFVSRQWDNKVKLKKNVPSEIKEPTKWKDKK